MLTLKKKFNINLIQNIQITKSHYIKLTLQYVKNSTQKFLQRLILIQILQNVFFYCAGGYSNIEKKKHQFEDDVKIIIVHIIKLFFKE